MKKQKILLLLIFFLSFFKNTYQTSASWSSIDSPAFIVNASNHNVTQAGDILQFAPLVIALGYVIYYQDTNLHRIRSFKDFFSVDRYKDDGLSQLVMTTGAAVGGTSIIKMIVNRHRPSPTSTSDRFNSSFPSGHTSMAMGPSFFIARRYGWLQAAPALAISAFVGYSRIQAQAHYITDVLGSTLFSFLSAYLLTFNRKIENVNINITPPIHNAKHFGNGVDFLAFQMYAPQYGAGLNFSW